MEAEIYQIDLEDSTGIKIPATAEVSVTHQDEPAGGWSRQCKVQIVWPDGNFEATDRSVYHAFAAVREQLEPLGLVPLCFGACPEVQVSGMAVEMSDGIIAYRLSDPRDGWGGPTVNIFDSGPDISPASVAEQRQYRQRRRSS
ncbi:MAG TPA: hypothetical protein DD473_22135 [Planctomycetaceae bacterium]|mgnify:FL=1|nr:hypothetical protein [Planctomycetaceae bacterium]